jgi:hypothetical protein
MGGHRPPIQCAPRIIDRYTQLAQCGPGFGSDCLAIRLEMLFGYVVAKLQMEFVMTCRRTPVWTCVSTADT